MSTTSEESYDEVQTFEQDILTLMATDEDVELFPMKKYLTDDEERDEYFEQHLPFLRKEIIDSADKEKETILRNKKCPFTISKSQGQRSDVIYFENIHGHLIKIKFEVMKNDLPKLDHGFNFELCYLMNNDEMDSSLEIEPFSRGIYCIAKVYPKRTRKREYQVVPDGEENDLDGDEEFEDEDEHSNRNFLLSFEIILLDSDIDFFESIEKTIKVRWLLGLIPMSRMYEACLLKPEVRFENELIRNEESTLISSELTNAVILSHSNSTNLNPIQKEVVKSMLVNVDRGPQGLHMIVGPPGTGKTTVAKNWLCNYIEKYPNHRILISAPSNQAVKILLQAAMKDIPHDKLAWLGIASKTDVGLEDVFVQGYVTLIIKDIKQEKIFLQKKIDQLGKGYKVNLPGLRGLRTIVEDLCNRIFALKCSNQAIKSNIKSMIKYKISSLKREVKDLRDRFYDEFDEYSPRNGARGIDKLRYILDCVKELIYLLNDNRFWIECYLIQRAQIVFSTLVSSGRQFLAKQIDTFDIILIDEAGQALVPEIFIPLKFNPQAMFLIGDPKQLPATISSQECKRLAYENSLMHLLIDDLRRPYHMLTIQYRMHLDICSWISDSFYEGRLETPESIRSRPSILTLRNLQVPLLTSPSLWIDVQGQEMGNELSPSTCNHLEAKSMIRMVGFLLDHCKYSMSQIGIISFYSGQIQLLKKLFEQYLSCRYQNLSAREKAKLPFQDWKRSHCLDIKTVDGYQGGEKDIVLISMVRTSRTIGFVDDARRLNVAMSRAKHARWIFGHHSQMKRCRSLLAKGLARYHENELKVLRFAGDLDQKLPNLPIA